MTLTPEQQAEFEERAAILEFDGKLPRIEAEREAMRLVTAKARSSLDVFEQSVRDLAATRLMANKAKDSAKV